MTTMNAWERDTLALAECVRDNLAAFARGSGSKSVNLAMAQEQIGQVIARLRHGPGPIEEPEPLPDPDGPVDAVRDALYGD